MEASQKAWHYAKKKITLYAERCEEKRTQFKKKIAAIDPKTLVYIDEAGVDNRLFRPYARSIKGCKIYADIPGKKRERHSMIGGWMQGQFIAPMTFQGGCNAAVLNAWLEHVLLPHIPKGSTLIMDNAAFHKSLETRKLIASAGCNLLFLPTYSPDLNPIECCWHTVKSRLKPLLQNCQTNLQEIIGQCLLTI
ncbi:MAG: IS630 family transposase [Alphaproteobacteria bacterium]